MGRHHPTEVRDVVTLRLARSERQLLERALRLRYPLTQFENRNRSLGEFVREAACSIAHQVIAAERPPADPRQVDLEELLAAHGGPRGPPLRWHSKTQGVAWAESPLDLVTEGEFVVKSERRRSGTTWWLQLHHGRPAHGTPRIERLEYFTTKEAAIAAADARVRLALRTRPLPATRTASSSSSRRSRR